MAAPFGAHRYRLSLGETIDIERDLGMDHWSKDMFAGHGVLFDRAQHVGDPNPKVMRGLFEYGREGCGTTSACA